MAWWHCPIGVLGMVLGIAVDLSTLPYLLCLFPGSPPSGRPQSVGPSWLRLRQSEKSCKQGFGASPVRDVVQSSEAVFGQAFRLERRKRALFLFGQAFRSERRLEVRSERCSSLASLGRPRSLRVVRNVVCWAELSAGKLVHEGPPVYEPDSI